MASASTLRSLMEIRVVLVIGSFMASASTLRFLIGIRVVLVMECHGSSACGFSFFFFVGSRGLRFFFWVRL